MVDVILGLQWGDEGKGKIVDYFASDYDVIARFQGGPNAGHTLYVGKESKKIVLHQIPPLDVADHRFVTGRTSDEIGCANASVA